MNSRAKRSGAGRVPGGPAVRIARALGLLAAACLGACAWTEPDPRQTLQVRIVDPNGAELRHADCRAANDRGVWPFVAPGAVTVPRSNVPLDITCGIETRSGFVRAIPQVKTWSPTDTLAVGGIHQALDPLRYPATGYPQDIEVVIGQALSVQPTASGAARTGR